jgi:tRNA dimethylallyltransferase
MNNFNPYDSLLVLGPTASGKTKLAVELAYHFNTEIISADSRQVYQELNIGSGKDLDEYKKDGIDIPYHLINICDLHVEFTLSNFIQHIQTLKSELSQRAVSPVICGGSGMYIESCIKKFDITNEPISKSLRLELELKSLEDLKDIYINHPHFKSDILENKITKSRLIRLIEALSYPEKKSNASRFQSYNPLIIGLNPDKEFRWIMIENRLIKRLNEGMIEEVESLLNKGFSHERLQRLGLEYKYISLYLKGDLDFEAMKESLFFEIRRFSKRQMTYFRKLEKDGFEINWIHGNLETIERLEIALKIIKNKTS